MKVNPKHVDNLIFEVGPFNNINGLPADSLFINLHTWPSTAQASVLSHLFFFAILLQICIVMHAISFGSTFVAFYIVSSICLFEVESKRLVDFEYGMKMWHNWTEATLKNKRGRLPKVQLRLFSSDLKNCVRISPSATPSKSKGGTTDLLVVCILGSSSM